MESELSKIHDQMLAEKDLKKFPVKSEAHGFLCMHKLRATKPRLMVVELLSREKIPLSVEQIFKKLNSKGALATTYRTLEHLSRAGLVSKIQNINKAHALYEIDFGRKHHHHATCTACGFIEDVSNCDSHKLDTDARIHLKKFSLIQNHSLEFFGLCRKCEAKISK
ncbi:MAG: transcriptional repressor [Patescibacteria group bacterium]|nr:transcriptional repressor [Patescibacteria group bacterium]